MPNEAAVPDPLKDALYVAVGFGVLAAQRANVKRLDFEQRHSTELAALESTVEQMLERVEVSLPEPARSWMQNTRSAGATVKERLHRLLG